MVLPPYRGWILLLWLGRVQELLTNFLQGLLLETPPRVLAIIKFCSCSWQLHVKGKRLQRVSKGDYCGLANGDSDLATIARQKCCNRRAFLFGRHTSPSRARKGQTYIRGRLDREHPDEWGPSNANRRRCGAERHYPGNQGIQQGRICLRCQGRHFVQRLSDLEWRR